MQFDKFTCNSFPSYTSIDTSAIDNEWRYRGWDDPVGKSLSKRITFQAGELRKKAKELIDYFDDLNRSKVLDNETVKYRSMLDSIKSNTAEGI